MTEPDGQLATLLGAQPPASVAALPAQVRADLAGLVRSALREQEAGLQTAFDNTLRHVPFPLRAVVKRIVL